MVALVGGLSLLLLPTPYRLRNGLTWLWLDAGQWMADKRHASSGIFEPYFHDELAFDQAHYLDGLVMILTGSIASARYKIPVPQTQTEYETLERIGVPGHPHRFTNYRRVYVPRIYQRNPSNGTYSVTMKPWSHLPPVQIASPLLRPRFTSDDQLAQQQISQTLMADIAMVPLSSVQRYWRVRSPLSQLRYCEPDTGTVAFVQTMAENTHEEPHLRALAREVLYHLK
jgi:hypothetical protein